MIIIKASKDSEAGVLPDEKLLTEMGQFNEELVKAGIMLAGEGLHPSSKGKRVRFSGGKQTVIDGPFAETKKLIAGFWLWQVKSMDEAIEWVKRCPTRCRARRRRSKFARSSRRRTSVPNSLPNSGSKRLACVRKPTNSRTRRHDAGHTLIVGDVGLAEELAQEPSAASSGSPGSNQKEMVSGQHW
jgi:hypothetical protein